MNAVEDLAMIAPDPELDAMRTDFKEMRQLCRDAAADLKSCAETIAAMSGAEKSQ
jgi:hypothetical protein